MGNVLDELERGLGSDVSSASKVPSEVSRLFAQCSGLQSSASPIVSPSSTDWRIVSDMNLD